MEYDSMQAYERRMRRFNLTVVVVALVALAIIISISWLLLQYGGV
jgi:hypothetical protein